MHTVPFHGIHICGAGVFLVQYFIWTAVYSATSSLNGIELPQMLTYFGLTSLIDILQWILQTGIYRC